MDNKMTEKQKAFCDYYLETLNASESYKRAYSSCKTDETARVNGCKLLTKANVKSYIEERLKQMESARIAKPEEILKYLTKVMRGEEKDQFNLDASLVDRTKAAELLAKRYGLLTDKMDMTGNLVIFNGEDKLED